MLAGESVDAGWPICAVGRSNPEEVGLAGGGSRQPVAAAEPKCEALAVARKYLAGADARMMACRHQRTLPAGRRLPLARDIAREKVTRALSHGLLADRKNRLMARRFRVNQTTLRWAAALF